MATVIGTSTNSSPVPRTFATLNATPAATATYVVLFNSGTQVLNTVSGIQTVAGQTEAALLSNANNKAISNSANPPKSVMITGINGMLFGTNTGNSTITDDTYTAGTNTWAVQSPTGGPTINATTYSPSWSGFHVKVGGVDYWHFAASGTQTAQPTAPAQIVHYAAATEGGNLTVGRTATFTPSNPNTHPPVQIVPWNGKVLMLTVDGATTNNIQGDATDSLTSSSPSAATASATVCVGPVVGLGTNDSMAALNDKSDGSGNVWMAYQASAGLSVVTLAAAAAGIGTANWSAPLVLTNPDGSGSTGLSQFAAFLGDGTGNMWIFWIRTSTNDVQVQRLTYAGGPVAVGAPGILVPGTTTSGANSRQFLTTQGYDATTAVLVYKEGTVSPFNVVAHFFALSTNILSPLDATPISEPSLVSLGRSAAYLMGMGGLMGSATALSSSLQGPYIIAQSGLTDTTPPVDDPSGTLSLIESDDFPDYAPVSDRALSGVAQYSQTDVSPLSFTASSLLGVEVDTLSDSLSPVEGASQMGQLIVSDVSLPS